MENIQQFARRLTDSRNLRMIRSSLEAMAQILRDRAVSDPAGYVELNNQLYRARVLLKAFGATVANMAERDFEKP